MKRKDAWILGLFAFPCAGFCGASVVAATHNFDHGAVGWIVFVAVSGVMVDIGRRQRVLRGKDGDA